MARKARPSLSVRAQLLHRDQVLVERRATLPSSRSARSSSVPVVIVTATLPAIAKEPLAPVDMVSPSDLAGPRDFGVTDLAVTDLAVSATDLGCSAVPLLNLPASGCTSYSFGNGLPNGLTIDTT